MTQPRVLAFAAPKRGLPRQEIDDAWSQLVLPSRTRVAVADGATESSFSALWARLLARGYTQGRLDRRLNSSFNRALALEQEAWEQRAPHPTAWYAQEKRDRGAHATLVGLTIRPNGRYTALAVGDCALFHVRAGRMDMFPAMTPDDFGSHPDLLSSRRTAPVSPQRRQGDWARGDHFILASDAAAAWIARLRFDDPDDALACAMDAARSRRQGDAWLGRERHAGRMRNDDVTIVVVECP